MTDLARLALDVVAVLEQAPLDADRRDAAMRWMRQWDVDRYRWEWWEPPVVDLAGGDRSVVGDVELVGDPPVAKVTIRGDRGVVTLALGFRPDEELLRGIVFEPPRHGIANVVIGCPVAEMRAVADVYGALLGMTVVREDWLKLGRSRRDWPQLAFGDGWSDDRPPRWPPDPAFPQQVHLDIAVRDLDDAERRVVPLGAVRVEDHGDHRVLLDPVGHALCLYEDAADDGEIARIVFDAPDPDASATFWQTLLSMPTRVLDTPDRVVIARADGIEGPMLGFQRSDSPPSTFPDPEQPAQLHLDLYFDEGKAAIAIVEAMGAVRRPGPGWSTVYADPAGHPFCIGSPHKT